MLTLNSKEFIPLCEPYKGSGDLENEPDKIKEELMKSDLGSKQLNQIIKEADDCESLLTPSGP